VWLWLSLHYFYERDRNFVKETLFRANCIAYSHIHTNIYKAMAKSGSKFSTSLDVLYNLCITESSGFRKKIYRFLSFLIGKVIPYISMVQQCNSSHSEKFATYWGFPPRV